MNVLVGIALLLPAAIMILAGFFVSSVRQDNVMTNHHFATNFNIRKYRAKVMGLFTLCGLAFSLCGYVIVKISMLTGFVLITVAALIFIALLLRLQKNS